MSDIVPISFYGKDVRVKEVNGEPWFCVADIGKIMGIINAKSSVKQLDLDTIKVNIQTDGGSQQFLFINEEGMYNLIFKSRKPKAKVASDIVIKDMVKKMGDVKKIIDAVINIEVPDDFGEMYVYAIKEIDTGNIKIGISADPVRRVKELQIANSSELELIWHSLAKNKFRDEKELHHKNAGNHIRGEWFSGDADFYEFN